jgi:hypothetical protein
MSISVGHKKDRDMLLFLPLILLAEREDSSFEIINRYNINCFSSFTEEI